MYSRLALRSPESDTDIENDLSSEAADSTGRCRCNQIAVDAVKELCGRCSGRCRDYLDRCMDSPIVERVGVIGQKIAFIGKTFLMMTDQYLDGGVMVSLHHHGFSSLAVIMAISVVSPQVIAWLFLKANGKESMVGLLVTLLFPSVSAAIFLTLWCTGTIAPVLQDVATFLVVVSAQPLRQLRHNLEKNKETDESVWTSVAEGLVEAPASAAITLYVAMLVSLTTHQGATPLFVVSVVFSLVMITLKSTALHFYGMEPSILEHMQVLLLQKFPQVASQVLGFVLVAFLTRPLPSDDDAIAASIRQSSQFSLALPVLALELSLNFSLLRSVSPQMSMAEALIFATTMVVGGPPGFLSALDVARAGHALQHLMCWVVMACFAHRLASSAHWTVLKEQYLPFVLLFITTLPVAFLVAIARSCRPTASDSSFSLSERLQKASRKLDEALMTKDRIMARLMLNIEGAEVQPGFLPTTGEVTFVEIPGAKGQGNGKWEGVCSLGDKLYFCPFISTEIMILDAATGEVTFVEIPEGKGQGKYNGSGVCALGDKLYFCPCNSREIMILDATTGEVTFVAIPEGKGGGHGKWYGVCALGDKVYFCPCNSREIMILDATTGEVTFVKIPEGKGQGEAKWSGVCALGDKVYFCPRNSTEIMILDATTGKVTFVEISEGKGEYYQKWCGVCALGDKLYFCPSWSSEIMILDATTGEVTFVEIPEGKGQGNGKWQGVCALGDKLYFCPSWSSEIMILDATTGEVTFVEIPEGKGQGKRKWVGVCALGDKVYFCPSDSTEIMRSKPPTFRRERCLALGLEVPGW